MKFLKKLKKSLKALFSLKPPPKPRKKKIQNSEMSGKKADKKNRKLIKPKKNSSKNASVSVKKPESKKASRKLLVSSPNGKEKSSKESLAKQKKQQELFVGVVTHYFPKAKAAVVDVKKHGLKVGDPILIRGKQTEFRQMLTSLQINRKPIESAKPGKEVGLHVQQDVHLGDCVFIVKAQS